MHHKLHCPTPPLAAILLLVGVRVLGSHACEKGLTHLHLCVHTKVAAPSLEHHSKVSQNAREDGEFQQLCPAESALGLTDSEQYTSRETRWILNRAEAIGVMIFDVGSQCTVTGISPLF